MSIRRLSAIAVPAFLLSFGLASAQDHAAHQAHDKLMKGASMAIEGCVSAGENPDTYVLGHVKEIPGQPVQTGLRRVYWLDSPKHLRGHVGQVVRIDARIDKVDDSKVELKPGEAKDGGMLVEFEGPGEDVDTTPATVDTTPSKVGTSGSAAKDGKELMTLIRLDVQKVTPVRACK